MARKTNIMEDKVSGRTIRITPNKNDNQMKGIRDNMNRKEDQAKPQQGLGLYSNILPIETITNKSIYRRE